MLIQLLLISSIALCVAGIFILAGKGKTVPGNPPMKAERYIVGSTLVLVGAITAISCGLALFTDNPRWLIEKVFELFS